MSSKPVQESIYLPILCKRSFLYPGSSSGLLTKFVSIFMSPFSKSWIFQTFKIGVLNLKNG